MSRLFFGRVEQLRQSNRFAALMAIAAFVGFLAIPAVADPCTTAARIASRNTGVPEHVFRALHDGKNLQSAPWSVTFAGERTLSFATKEAAQAHVFARFMRGARHFAVGCFQVQYDPRSTDFPTIEAMFDPSENAGAAATELQRLHIEVGTWPAAIAAYRSTTFSVALQVPPAEQPSNARFPTRPRTNNRNIQFTVGNEARNHGHPGNTGANS